MTNTSFKPLSKRQRRSILKAVGDGKMKVQEDLRQLRENIVKGDGKSISIEELENALNRTEHGLQVWLIEINVNPCLSRKCSAQKEVHLIEVNTNPALHCNCEDLKDVIPGGVEEALFVSIEAFEKSKKNLQLMSLQSLRNFTILYCGTRPNTIVPRQSRSVSPVKENTAEKPKYVPTCALRRASSPTRAHHRSSIHSTPLYTVHDRENESGNRESMLNTQTNSAKTTSASNKKSKTVASSDKTETNTSEEKSKSVEENSNESKEVPGDSDEKTSNESENTAKSEPKSHVVVVDTLTKINDNLTEANTMLGKLSQSLNQIGLAESILEEARLKMTHADQTAAQGEQPNSEKPKSANKKERI